MSTFGSAFDFTDLVGKHLDNFIVCNQNTLSIEFVQLTEPDKAALRERDELAVVQVEESLAHDDRVLLQRQLTFLCWLFSLAQLLVDLQLTQEELLLFERIIKLIIVRWQSSIAFRRSVSPLSSLSVLLVVAATSVVDRCLQVIHRLWPITAKSIIRRDALH